MKSKKTKKIIFIISVFCLFVCMGTIFAQNQGGDLEVQYPSFGGADAPQGTGLLLSTYIRYIYNFAIISGGLIALLSLIYGGFRFLTSAGKPAAITDARGQILAGFLGLVVIFGSYIILNELNPDLVSLRMPGVTGIGKRGIILYNQDCNTVNAAMGQSISSPESADIPANTNIMYKPLSGNGGSAIIKTIKDENNVSHNIIPVSFYNFHEGKELTLEIYNNESCNGSPISAITNLQKNTCQEFNIDNVQCIKLVWYTSGIWVFNQLDNNNVPDPTNLPEWWEEGKQYMVFQSSQDALPRGFHDNIRAIAIVPNETLNRNYGVIAHNIDGAIPKEKGWAHIYLPGDGTDSKCALLPNTNITGCGPFGDQNSRGQEDISSLTIFNVPSGITSAISDIKICRNDRCESQTVDENGTPESHDVAITCSPELGCDPSDSDVEFTPITDIFCGSTTFNLADGLVYGANLGDGKWDTDNPIALGRNVADGISAIEINEGAKYLVLLYEDLDIEFNAINDDTRTDAAIINATNESLRTIQMDGRVGTIIIINTDPGQNY